jgi:hypothetical protein
MTWAGVDRQIYLLYFVLDRGEEVLTRFGDNFAANYQINKTRQRFLAAHGIEWSMICYGI